MLEPDVTLTDFALATGCAVFAFFLSFRVRNGIGTKITAYFAALFVALSAASAIGGTYHGFFSETRSAQGDAVWLATLLAIGFVSFFTWLAAGQIQLTTVGQRLVFLIAIFQLLGYSIYVIFISRDFLVASASTALPMVFLLLGYIRALVSGSGTLVTLGLAGLLVAFSGAALQQVKVGIHPEYFNHNAVYHVIQFVAFALIFASIPGLERRQFSNADSP